jgi:hypothetical protein
MIPVLSIYSQVMALLAADTTTFDQATDALIVTLLNQPFTPSVNTVYSALSPATFVGSTPIAVTLGAQEHFRDPVSGNYVLQLSQPIGGWKWQCTTAPGAAETIYGYVVTTSDTSVTLGSGLLDTPVVIQAVLDAVVIPEIAFGVVPGSFEQFDS